jgi:hypothetical protein
VELHPATNKDADESKIREVEAGAEAGLSGAREASGAEHTIKKEAEVGFAGLDCRN